MMQTKPQSITAKLKTKPVIIGIIFTILMLIVGKNHWVYSREFTPIVTATGTSDETVVLDGTLATKIEACYYTDHVDVKPGYPEFETTKKQQLFVVRAKFTNLSKDQYYSPTRYIQLHLLDTKGRTAPAQQLTRIANNPSLGAEDNITPGGSTTMDYVYILAPDYTPQAVWVMNLWYSFDEVAKINLNCINSDVHQQPRDIAS